MPFRSDPSEEESSDLQRFGGDEPAEMICPACKSVVIEDTEKCPHCGDWITPIDADHAGPRKWIYVLALIIMLLIALRMAF